MVQRPQKPVLSWLDSNGAVRSDAPRGKSLTLRADGLTTPSPFAISHRNWLSRLPGIGRKFRPLVASVPTRVTSGATVGRRQWVAGGPIPSAVGRMTVYFEDDGGNRSNDLSVVNHFDVRFLRRRQSKLTGSLRPTGQNLSIEAGVPAFGALLPEIIGQRQGELVLWGTVASPLDPLVQAAVLTPWDAESDLTSLAFGYMDWLRESQIESSGSLNAQPAVPRMRDFLERSWAGIAPNAKPPGLSVETDLRAEFMMG